VKALIRLLNVEGEPLRITVLPQPPSKDHPYQSWEIGEATLASLLEDLAYAAAQRMRPPRK
jgi:predicted metalloenzyme YecM